MARLRGSVKWTCEFMVVNPWLIGGLELCPPLICTKRCVYGGVWGEGNAVSRWETMGEVFFRGVRRRVPGRTNNGFSVAHRLKNLVGLNGGLGAGGRHRCD